MSGSLVREPTPEEQELQIKQAELAALEAELAQRELDLATFQAELHGFERRYLQIVGTRHKELDHIEAQIAEYLRHLETAESFRPSPHLKQLYREVAKRIHPDLATDPQERTHREELMAAANQAYEAGDEAQLQAILKDWDSSPASVQGKGTVVNLVRTIRQISQSRSRLEQIEQQIHHLEQTDLFQLRVKTMNAEKLGRDLLTEMANQVDKKIERAQQQLNELKAKIG